MKTCRPLAVVILDERAGPATIVMLLAAIALARCATDDPVRAAENPVYVPPGVERLSGDGRFSNLANLPDGRLFNWFALGENPGNPASIQNPDIPQKAFGRFSTDGGRTWSKPFFLFEFPRAKGARLAGVCLCDRDAVLHLFGLDYWTADVKTPDPARYRCDLFHTMSRDLGKTWSAVRQVDFKHTYTGATNSVIQLRRGRILVPLSYFSSRKTGKFVSTCVYSDDGGRTWQKSKSDLAVDSGHADIESGACEPVCLELKDNRVRMMIRTQTGYQYESFSSDGGDTWSEPAQTGFVDTNAPAQLLRLRDGRILIVWNNCTFGNIPGFRGDRFVCSAAISADDGKTWQGYREIARMTTSGVIGYPFLCEVPEGKVLVSLFCGSQMLRLDPQWLLETSDREDFSAGLDQWSVAATEGVALSDHPDQPGRKVLSFRKTNPAKAAAMVRNFPFGVRGRLDLRLRLNPGFQGARLCLNDYQSLPPVARKGRFGLRLSGNGLLYFVQGDGEDLSTGARLPAGKWFTLTLLWDCAKKQCVLKLDDRWLATLPQLPAPDLAEYPPNLADGQEAPEAKGICYLRVQSTAETTDFAGMMLESLSVDLSPHN